jgi:hypothetical protein
VNPTQEQVERLKVWLDTRLSAIFTRSPFPRLPHAIEVDLKSGVDFTDIFAEYGFTADRLGLLPNFYEIHKKNSAVSE